MEMAWIIYLKGGNNLVIRFKIVCELHFSLKCLDCIGLALCKLSQTVKPFSRPCHFDARS